MTPEAFKPCAASRLVTEATKDEINPRNDLLDETAV